MRTFSVLACTSIKLFRLGLRGVRAVFLEDPGWRKLAEPVAHHVFRDEDRVEDFAVMHVERQSDKIRRDHRTAGPGLDWRLGPRLFGLHDLVGQMLVNERSFFYPSSHMAHAAGLVTLRQQAPGRGELLPAASALGFARAAAVGMVHRVA